MAYAANKRSDDIIYPGLIAAWDIKKEGKDNDHPDREWARDLTGNGHDIQWKNLAFSGMSGYGGYTTNFSNWIFDETAGTYKDAGNNKFTITSILKENYGFPYYPLMGENKIRINVSGIVDEVITFGNSIFGMKPIKNGINEFIGNFGSSGVNSGFRSETIIENCNITIELLPEYEGAICLDGVDDFGINKNMPILQTLTDYTIIGKRKYLSSSINCVFMSCRNKGSNDTSGLFQFERNLDNINNVAISFGQTNYNINFTEQDITYQTKNSYNGKSIQSNSPFYTTSKELSIGSLYNGHPSRIKMAFYCAYLFDRSLDEQEIKSFIREYIDPDYVLPSEDVTPDCYYDFSQGSNDDETRETITDYSGNGNDAKAYNFAWSGMSGYGGYPFKWSQFIKEENYGFMDLLYEGYKLTIKSTPIPLSTAFLYKLGFTGTNFKIKVTNKPDDITLQIGSLAAGKQELFNGENTITLTFSNMPIGLFVTPCTDQNIIIEIIPQYPGALVLDGVDDYIALEAFDSGFKTIFMLCKPFAKEKILYDQRRNGVGMSFAIYNGEADKIAYSQRNNGKTYINGILNTSIPTGNLLNKKHLITISNSNISESQKPNIATNYNHGSFHCNMAIYKFLGFKDELTEEQIQYVIEKYNLLD